MEEFLGTIYDYCFKSLYGTPLNDYLWGYCCETQAYDNPIVYNQIGFWALISAIILPLLYYYAIKPVRHQQLCYWILLLSTALVNGVYAYIQLTMNFDNGLIGDCLVYNEAGIQVITNESILYFAISNFIVTAIFYFIASLIVKWGSKSCKHYPF